MAQNSAEFTVEGIESDEEVREIEAELGELKGVMGTEISSNGEAAIKYDYDVLSEERIKITVREMGYEVE